MIYWKKIFYLLDMEFLASFLRNWEAHIQVKISFDRREPEGLGVGVQNLRGETPHMGARPGTPPPLPRMYAAPWTEYRSEARIHHRQSRQRRRRPRPSVPSSGCGGRYHRVFRPHNFEACISSPSLDNGRSSLASEVKMESGEQDYIACN